MKKLFSFWNKTFKRSAGQSEFDQRVKRLYEQKNYLDAYSEHTDIRVEIDPHMAIGGMWDKIGNLQFEFLVSSGLQPQHKMLDIGCGTLRGGRHFIRYLNSDNYYGLDISQKAIEFGEQLIKKEGLFNKHPRLVLSQHKDLKFGEFEGEKFDFLLAQSVFTHLMPEHIEECFQHIGRLMDQNSVFFFTFNEFSKFKQTGLKDFCYPFSFLQEIAKKYGFTLKNKSDEYPHPRGQKIVAATKN